MSLQHWVRSASGLLGALCIISVMMGAARSARAAPIPSWTIVAQSAADTPNPFEPSAGPYLSLDQRTRDGAWYALTRYPIWVFLVLAASLCKGREELFADLGAYFTGFMLLLVLSGAGLFTVPEWLVIAALAASVFHAGVESFRNRVLVPHWLSCAIWGAIHGLFIADPLGRRLDPSAPLRFAEVRPYAVGVGFVVVAGMTGAVLLRWGIAKWRERGAYQVVAGLTGFGVAAAVAAPLVLGPATVSRKEAERVILELHQLMYEAYTLGNEGEIYDTLDDCMAGDLLVMMQEDLYDALLDRDEDGTGFVVEALQPSVIVFRKRTATSFVVDYSWVATTALTHAADRAVDSRHTHRQTSAHTERYTVEQTPQGWRIVDQVPLESEQIADRPLLAPES